MMGNLLTQNCDLMEDLSFLACDGLQRKYGWLSFFTSVLVGSFSSEVVNNFSSVVVNSFGFVVVSSFGFEQGM